MEAGKAIFGNSGPTGPCRVTSRGACSHSSDLPAVRGPPRLTLSPVSDGRGCVCSSHHASALPSPPAPRVPHCWGGHHSLSLEVAKTELELAAQGPHLQIWCQHDDGAVAVGPLFLVLNPGGSRFRRGPCLGEARALGDHSPVGFSSAVGATWLLSAGCLMRWLQARVRVS